MLAGMSWRLRGEQRLGRSKSLIWYKGHSAFTVSASQMDTVKRYIENQEEHHRTKNFQDEYLEFLQKYGVEYDERYLW